MMYENPFHHIVQRMNKLEEWMIVKEEKTQAFIKEKPEDPTSVLSHLEVETRRFQELEPSITNSIITRLINDTKNARWEKIDLEFHVHNEWYCLRGEMYDFIKNGDVMTQFFTRDENWELPSLIEEKKLTVDIQNDLNRIYQHFKEIISSMESYRLHFIAGGGRFSHTQVADWLDEE